MNKKGFSFGEMLLTMIIIGIISAITIPVLVNSLDSNNKVLFKTAFKNVESIVNELINDISIYPSGELTNNTFCSNFFGKVNVVGNFDCSGSAFPATPNAKTTNGMYWFGIESDFEEANCPSVVSGEECIRIKVDVNGDKGDTTDSGDNRDVFNIYVYTTGKVTVEPSSLEETHLFN